MRDIPDYFTKSGAELLAGRIRLFWEARGWDVTTTLERVPMPADRPIFCVRSDLVNGMPQKRLEEKAA